MDSRPPRLARLLPALHPDEFALRHRVAAQLDASMLDDIAAADYGNDFDQHRTALTRLLAEQRWPGELDWHPGEVLELIRWSEPEAPDLSSGPIGRRGHLMRLFACMVLIRVRTSSGGPSNSLAPLVMSALELGSPMVEDALRYLAWCRSEEPGDWRDDVVQRPFLTFGLLLLATATRPAHVPLAVLAGLLLDDVEAALVEEGREWQLEVAAPLFGLRAESLQFPLWCELARRCLIDDGDRRIAALGRAICRPSESSTSDIRPLFLDNESDVDSSVEGT